VQLLFTIVGVAVFALLGVYAERKVSAFIQDRLGPMEVGPFGIIQTFADVLKLVHKELIKPTQADARLFWLAPIVVFAAVIGGFAVIPFGPAASGAAVNSGIYFFLAILGIDIIGLLMAGWGSNNKFALLGAARAVAQIVSYEVPTAIVLLSAVMMYGSLDLNVIALQQGIFSPTPVRLLGLWDISRVGGIVAWGIICWPHLLIGYVVYFIASLAECNRAPFDLPEAESELVSGYHTEYSGFGFAIFMLSEYGKMLLVSLLAAIVFLGGWNTILPNIGPLRLADWTSGPSGTIAGAMWGFFWLMVKACFGVFMQVWVRWAYPRLRVDQLMSLCWKYLTPIGFVLFMISGIWKIAVV